MTKRVVDLTDWRRNKDVVKSIESGPIVVFCKFSVPAEVYRPLNEPSLLRDQFIKELGDFLLANGFITEYTEPLQASKHANVLVELRFTGYKPDDPQEKKDS